MANRTLEPYQDRFLPEQFLRWIEVLRQKIASYPCFFQGTGSPEGVISAGLCDRYCDEATGALYIKGSATGNTGWVQVGGGGGGALITDRTMSLRTKQSDGNDSTIAFQHASWDSINNRMLLAGDSSFVGFINAADLPGSKIQETAANPTGNARMLIANDQDNGMLALVSNSLERAPTDGGSWTDITNFGSFTVHGIASYQNHIVVKRFRTAGDIDHAYSDDNGATFTNDTSGMGSNTGGGQPAVSPDGSKLIMMNTAGFITITTSLTFPATWTATDLNVATAATGSCERVLMNTDGSEIMFLMDSGDIVTSDDGGSTFTLIPRDENPFFSGGSHTGQTTGVYSAALGGWLLGKTAGGIIVFYADGALDTPQAYMPMVTYPGGTFTSQLDTIAADPTDPRVLWFGNSNTCLQLTPWL